MNAHEILQIIFYSLAGVTLIGLLIYLWSNKKQKWKEKLSLTFLLLLSSVQSFVNIIMTAVNSNVHQDN